MADESGAPERSGHRHLTRRGRLVEAFYSPDSYGMVLLLILLTYAVSVSASSHWTDSFVVVVQVATVWITLRASQARRHIRQVATVTLILAAVGALANLVFVTRVEVSAEVTSVIGAILYVGAALAIVRHLFGRQRVDGETVLGAIASYLMVGMAFAFTYRALGAAGAGPFFGPQGDGTFA